MATPNPLLPYDGEHWFTADALWWRTVCGRFDEVAGRLAEGQPSRTFAAAGRLGRLAHLVHACGPRPDEVAALFPTMTRRDCRRTACRIAELRVKNRAAIALVHRGGLAQLEARVDEAAGALRALAHLPGPTVLVTWHVGAMYGIGAALRRAGLPALILRSLPLDTSGDRTRALWQAIHHLRAGKLVVALLDGPGGVSTAPVSCLGRQIVFRRGPFLLAKTTGAQLVPIVTSWEPGERIGITLGDPLLGSVGGSGEHGEPLRTRNLTRLSQVSGCASDRSGPSRGAGPLEPLRTRNLTHQVKFPGAQVTAAGRGSAAEGPLELRLAAEAAEWIERYLVDAPAQIWLYTLRNLLDAPSLHRMPLA